MSKTSSVYRNLKRVKMAAKYANVRSKLKAIVNDKNAPEEERFQATLKLAELPRNSSKVRIRNRCKCLRIYAWRTLKKSRNIITCRCREMYVTYTIGGL